MSHSRPRSEQVHADNFKHSFFANPYHIWIKNHEQLCTNINLLFNRFTAKHIDYFLAHPFVLIKSNGLYSCTIYSLNGVDAILIFPHLLQILSSFDSLTGQAILAHELGHLIYRNIDSIKDALESQIRADFFAIELGLSQELVEILKFFNSLESTKRIEAIIKNSV